MGVSDMSSYGQYRIVQAVPEPTRGERVNIGVIMMDPDSRLVDIMYDCRRITRLLPEADIRPYQRFLDGLKKQVGQLSFGDSWTMTSGWLNELAESETSNLVVSTPGAIRLEGSWRETLNRLFEELVERPHRERTRSTIRLYRHQFHAAIRRSPDLAARVMLGVSMTGPLGDTIEVDALIAHRMMVRLGVLDTQDAQDRLFQLFVEVELAQQHYELSKDCTVILLRPPDIKSEAAIHFLEKLGNVVPIFQPAEIDKAVETTIAALALR
jgi:hypothetical protein